jgi:hypothetical protein
MSPSLLITTFLESEHFSKLMSERFSSTHHCSTPSSTVSVSFPAVLDFSSLASPFQAFSDESWDLCPAA